MKAHAVDGIRVDGAALYRTAPHIAKEQKKENGMQHKEPGQTCPPSDFDRCVVGYKEGAKPQAWTQEQVAEALRQQYSGVSFTFTDSGSLPEDVAQFAAQAGPGIHVVVSSDILSWMAKGQEAWEQGARMIGQTICQLMKEMVPGSYSVGAVIGDHGEITLWSAKTEEEEAPKQEWEQEAENIKNMLDRLEENRKKMAERQKKLRLTQKKKINYQIGRDMARLAKGVTAQNVRSLISRVYAARGRIAASTLYDKKEAQAAVAQMDHVIRCARTKIRQLKEEDNMELRRKKAEKDKEEKLKKRLEKELKERRRARKAKEHARIFERPDLPGLRNDEERRQAQEAAMAAAASVGLSAAGSGGLEAAGDASGVGGTQGGASAGASASSGEAIQVTVTVG